MDKIHALYQPHFSLGTPMEFNVKSGVTVHDLVGILPLPGDFENRGVVMVNEIEVPRALWAAVRPKPTTHLMPIDVTFHIAPAGGGGGGGGGGSKNVVALIAGLALTIATAGIAGGALSGFLGAGTLAAGSLGATALAAGVGLAGSLLIGALVSPPSITGNVAETRDDKTAVSLSGNVLEANTPIPRVIGTRRVFPPVVTEPRVFYENGDEFVEAVYALAGPHKLEDIRIGDNPIDDSEDVQFEVLEGWSSDSQVALVTNQSKTDPVQIEMSYFTIENDDSDALDSELEPEEALPVWHGVASGFATDEFYMNVFLPEGVNRNASGTEEIRIPIRLRFRKKGESGWNNVPEFHYRNATIQQQRATIKFIFAPWDGIVSTVPSATGFIEARKLAIGQSVAPPTSDWEAASYFSAGAGDDVMANGLEGTTNVKAIRLEQHEAQIYLDPAVYPPGTYEVEIKRGNAFRDSSFVSAAYTYGGAVYDFFNYRVSGTKNIIPQNIEGAADTMFIPRVVSVWYENPVVATGFALIAIVARNRRIDRLSVTASGYVKDWSGGTWDNYVVTSNPAPHYRDILAGDLNFNPLPDDLIDDTDLVEWRTECASNGYTCDLIAEGVLVSELLRIVSACGFARPYNSEIYGVARDYDKSAESPVQIFSPRNSNNFKFRKAFSKLPSGLRINYADVDSDGSQSQIIEYRNGVGSPAKLEQISYVGLIDESKVRKRARFDLAQGALRNTFYEFEAPIESVRCRSGDLIGVQHDIISTRAGTARITGVTLNPVKITGIDIDSVVDVFNEVELLSVADVLAEPDFLLIGRASGVAIRRTNGAVTVHPLSNATGETSTLNFASTLTNSMTPGGPFDTGTIPEVDVGALVTVGDIGTEYRRLIATTITPASDLGASITAVDEAPEIWSL